MKYAIIIPDGCADEPQESLGGKTPLEAAHVPGHGRHCDGRRRRPRATTRPTSLPAGSDVANLEPAGLRSASSTTPAVRPWRPPPRASSSAADDWAVRCNLVTIEDQVMRDFTAGHISTGEAADLLATAQEQLGDDRLHFYPGVSYRNLLVYRGAGRPAPFSRRHPHHAAARSDRQERAGRLSPRAGQRPAEPPDEPERRAFSPIIRSTSPGGGRQAAGHERLALGTRAARRT